MVSAFDSVSSGLGLSLGARFSKPVITILLRIVRSMNIGRAGTVYKGLYNWPNETIGKQHKQCP